MEEKGKLYLMAGRQLINIEVLQALEKSTLQCYHNMKLFNKNRQ